MDNGIQKEAGAFLPSMVCLIQLYTLSLGTVGGKEGQIKTALRVRQSHI